MVMVSNRKIIPLNILLVIREIYMEGDYAPSFFTLRKYKIFNGLKYKQN